MNMDNKLFDTKVSIHKKQVEKLHEIEEELTKLISEVDNDILHEKYIDWLNQRTRCNESYVALTNIIMKSMNIKLLVLEI